MHDHSSFKISILCLQWPINYTNTWQTAPGVSANIWKYHISPQGFIKLGLVTPLRWLFVIQCRSVEPEKLGRQARTHCSLPQCNNLLTIRRKTNKGQTCATLSCMSYTVLWYLVGLSLPELFLSITIGCCHYNLTVAELLIFLTTNNNVTVCLLL